MKLNRQHKKSIFSHKKHFLLAGNKWKLYHLKKIFKIFSDTPFGFSVLLYHRYLRPSIFGNCIFNFSKKLSCLILTLFYTPLLVSHWTCIIKKQLDQIYVTAWKVSKYRVICGPYFPAFGLNTERNFASLRIQSECGKIQTRNNSVFEHFSCSVYHIHDD